MNSYHLRLQDNRYGEYSANVLKTLCCVAESGTALHPRTFSNCDDEKYKSVIALLTKYSGQCPAFFRQNGIACFGDITEGHGPEDGSETNQVFSIYGGDGKECIHTGNNMGVMRLRDKDVEVTLEIRSRFDAAEQQLFLVYMLSKAFGGNTADWIGYAKAPMWDILQIILFRNRLADAYAQGVFKKYMRFEHNDTRFRGRLNINEHLRQNISFRGTLAYTTHEFSHDNPITRLIRHTLRHVHGKYPYLLAGTGEELDEAQHAIEQHTPSWDPRGLQRCLQENVRPLMHPYFSAYEPLRQACLSVLRDEGALLYGGDAENEAEGIIFDGAWLWENYLATILLPLGYTHPDNLSERSPINLFCDPKSYRRYPDFYHDKAGIVLDAKYKSLTNDEIGREDMHQLITYMHVLRSRAGGLIYPRGSKCGAAPEKLLGTLNGCGGKVYTVGFDVPGQTDGTEVEPFRKKMCDEEKKVTEAVIRLGNTVPTCVR